MKSNIGNTRLVWIQFPQSLLCGVLYKHIVYPKQIYIFSHPHSWAPESVSFFQACHTGSKLQHGNQHISFACNISDL